MISNITFTFVLMPCIGAVVMAALLHDWRLVVAAGFGALGVIALGRYIPDPVRLISLPLVTGVIIGAMFLAPRLMIRPTSDIWSRMLWAIIPTFVITFLFLLMNTNGA
jgi:hypothetical protein